MLPPPPILPPCCNPILCSHAAAKIVKLQHHTNTAGGCRWWSTVSWTFKGSQLKRSVAIIWSPPLPLAWLVLLFHLMVRQLKWWEQSLLTGASSAASTSVPIIQSVGRHQSQIIPIYLAAYKQTIMGNDCQSGLNAGSGCTLGNITERAFKLIIIITKHEFPLPLFLAYSNSCLPLLSQSRQLSDKAWLFQSALLLLKGKLLTVTSCLECNPCKCRKTNSTLRTGIKEPWSTKSCYILPERLKLGWLHFVPIDHSALSISRQIIPTPHWLHCKFGLSWQMLQVCFLDSYFGSVQLSLYNAICQILIINHYCVFSTCYMC